MKATFYRPGSWCSEPIRSVRFDFMGNQVTTGQCFFWVNMYIKCDLVKVTMYIQNFCQYKVNWKPLFDSWVKVY